jgi:hypothetical protein
MSSAFPRPEDGVGSTPLASDGEFKPIELSVIPRGEAIGTTADGVPIAITESLELFSDHVPHIALTRTITMRTNGATIRDCRAEFWFEGSTLWGSPRRVLDVKIIDHAIGRENRRCLMIEYENAVVGGADNIDAGWPTEFRSWVSELVELRCKHCVIIPLPDQHPDYIKTLQTKIGDYQKFEQGQTLRPFFRIKDSPGLESETESDGTSEKKPRVEVVPVTSWESMSELHEQGPLKFPKLSARNVFPDLTTAEIVMCNGRFLDHKWEEKLFDRLAGAAQVALVLLDKTTALAFVRYKKPLPADLKNVLSDRTRIEIATAQAGYCESRSLCEGSGSIVANRLDIKAEFVALLKKRQARHLFMLATPVRSGGPVWREASVSIVQDRSLAQREINAIQTLCSAGSLHARFQKIFLAENLGDPLPQNWLVDDLGCTQRKIDLSLQAIIQKMEGMGRKLNPEQESILRNVQSSHNFVDVVRGPPGCGKTTLMAAIAEMIIRCSSQLGILMCAPSNGNTQRIWQAVTDILLIKPSVVEEGGLRPTVPQRVYRAHLEEDHFINAHDIQGKRVEESIDAKDASRYARELKKVESDAEWYRRVAEADTKREFSNPDASLAASVIDLIKRDVTFDTGDAQYDLTMRNATTTLRAQLEMFKQKAFRQWTYDNKLSFKNNWHRIAQGLVSRKQIICCTVGNITSRLMSNALGGFRKGVIMVDEASLTTDGALCNAIVNVIQADRIRSEFEGISPILKVIVIGDEAQGYPLVKTEHEPFNYFGRQVAQSPYQRYVLSGAGVQAMYEQYRMVPALCELPNARWYGGRLRCSEERQQARLTAEQKQSLSEFFELDLAKARRDGKSYDECEDAHLRMLLANVPAGKCEVEPQTQSRLNMANVDVIIRIFKDLVRLDPPFLYFPKSS